MPVPRFTTLSLIVRFLLKKVIVYILVLAIVAVFGTNPLTYGIPWLLMALLVWCILDAAALYGDVWAYADLKEALAKGRDPETLVEAWQRRDAGLQKFDGVVLAILGVGVILMGYSKWLGALGVIFGLAKLIPFISEVDPRDIEKMVVLR